MKFKLEQKTFDILQHIVFLSKKSAKIVNFQFLKGRTQTYVSPKQDIFVKFDLPKPITFDYSIFDLESFIAEEIKEIDSTVKLSFKSKLVYPTQSIINKFTKSKIIETVNCNFDFLQKFYQPKKLKFKYFNIYSNEKKLSFRFQNHHYDYWSEETDNQIIENSNIKTKKKFRYIIERSNVVLFPDDYEIILRKQTVQFRCKNSSQNLSIFLTPEKEYHGVQVRKFFDANSDEVTGIKLTDKDLIKLYQRKKSVIYG